MLVWIAAKRVYGTMKFYNYDIYSLESGQYAFLDCSFPIKANVLLYTHRKHD